MKLLIDSSAHGSLTPALQAVGHDVLSVAAGWPNDPGDLEILARASSEQRIVITRDKDFGELAIVQRQPHCGIIRLWDTPAAQQFAVCQAVLAQYGTDLLAGAIITASPYRVRMRPPRSWIDDLLDED